MAQEKEVKFPIDDLGAIKKRLEEIGFCFVDRYFEENYVFDFFDKRLKKERKILRLRTVKGVHTLCFKKPSLDSPKNVKVMDEFETKISNKENLVTILENLGLYVAFKYEKIREKWKRENCLVCVDILPFGDYLEIESRDEVDIMNVAKDLGLDLTKKDLRTYHEINIDKRKELGLTPDDNYVFDQWKNIRQDLNGVLDHGL